MDLRVSETGLMELILTLMLALNVEEWKNEFFPLLQVSSEGNRYVGVGELDDFCFDLDGRLNSSRIREFGIVHGVGCRCWDPVPQ